MTTGTIRCHQSCIPVTVQRVSSREESCREGEAVQILRKAAMMAEAIAPAQVRSRGSCADLRAICMRTVINKAPAERDEEADSAISCSLALVCVWVLVRTARLDSLYKLSKGESPLHTSPDRQGARRACGHLSRLEAAAWVIWREKHHRLSRRMQKQLC